MPTLPTIIETAADVVKRHGKQRLSLFNQLRDLYLRQYDAIWKDPVNYFAAAGTGAVNEFATAATTVTYLLSFDPTSISAEKQVPPASWNITENSDGTVVVTAKV